MLTQLKLARICEIHQEWFDRAAEKQMPYPDFLRGLLQEELLAREANSSAGGSRTPPPFPSRRRSTPTTSGCAPSSTARSFSGISTIASSARGHALYLVGPTGLGKTTSPSRSAWLSRPTKLS
jgi:hypothetical protein